MQAAGGVGDDSGMVSRVMVQEWETIVVRPTAEMGQCKPHRELAIV
jgi:hypothetical protein